MLEIGRDESVTPLIQLSVLPTLQVTEQFLPTSNTSSVYFPNLWPWIRMWRGWGTRGESYQPLSWSERLLKPLNLEEQTKYIVNYWQTAEQKLPF